MDVTTANKMKNGRNTTCHVGTTP
jgi:hypothetical protein